MEGSGESGTFLWPARTVEVIEQAFVEAAAAFQPLGRASWRCVLSNGMNVRVGTRLDGDWLLMGARLTLGSWLMGAIDPWSLLRANADLSGAVKFVILPADPGLFARAELPVAAGVDLGLRVVQACAGFKQAAAIHAGLVKKADDGAADTTQERKAESREVSGARRERKQIDLRGLCEEAGWISTERPDGTNVVALDLPDDFAPAQVEVDPCGALRVATEIPPCGGTPSPRCRQALGVLLLRAGGALRLARAAAQVSAQCEDGPPGARFEVVFDTPPCATELGHAFAALSVACRLYRREAGLLRDDERIAGAYLHAISTRPNRNEAVQGQESSGHKAR
jgi:hypothetical protein